MDLAGTIANYLAGLCYAWHQGLEDGSEALTAREEVEEVFEPRTCEFSPGATWFEERCLYCGVTREYVSRIGGCVGPLCPTFGLPPVRHTESKCPYCGGKACCPTAAEDVEFYRWEHGFK